MKKYKLLLVGCFPGWEENTSCSFFSEEFAFIFRLMPHIELITCHFHEKNIPSADFALVHAYEEEAFVLGRKLRGKVKKSCYFMENYFPSYDYDHYWFYDPHFCNSTSNQTFVKIPLVKKYYEVVPKVPKTLLLDHDAKLFSFYGEANKDWNSKIWDLLKKDNCGYQRIAQLGRNADNHPDFIEIIPKQKHVNYLEATKDFQTYFITHTGSYNHTAVDMAIRGIRTIVPKGFVPQGLIKELQMIEVSTDEEILSALKDHKAGTPQLEKATDLQNVVEKIDSYFLHSLKSFYY